MALGRRRRGGGGLEAWPGYVDALSTLLMVIIFVLLVFVLAQGFLSVALSSRDRALERLNRQVSELSELLALERGQAEELRTSLSRTAEELRASSAAREALSRNLSILREDRDRLAQERDATRTDRDRLAARIADLELAAGGGATRIAELEGRLAEALARAEAAGGDAARTVRTLTDAQRLLAAERAALEAVRRDLAAARDQAAALSRDLAQERATREATARDLAQERTAREATVRDLAMARNEGEALAGNLAAEREARAQRERELAQAREQGQALARDLTTTRQARDTANEALEARRREAEELARDLATARAALEAARRDIATLRDEAALLDRTVRADRATIEARLSDIARLTDEIRGLEALRDQLERQAAATLARLGEEERQRGAADLALADARRMLEAATNRAGTAEQAAAAADARAQEAERARAAATLLATEAGRRAQETDRARSAAEGQAAEHARLSESARAQVALLTRQLEALRAELARVAATLEAEENAGRDKEAQIVALGQRLNAALAARVEELQQYRSDFFGRLRRVLGDRPEVRIVGDRFVFQSEVLFPVGGAELSTGGQQQVRDLARVLIDLAAQFPPDLAWVLRVDGHADRSPIRPGGRFASNWELSAARSIAVAQLLMQEGLPSNRIAAAAFGETQPLDDRDAPDAFARNRRIELRLEAGPAGTRAAAPAPARKTQEAIRGLACGRVAELQGGGLVAGIGPRGSQARLRAALPGATPRLAIAEFDGPYCPVLEALRPVEPSAAASALRIGLGNGNPVREGDPLLFDLALPDWAAHVTLVYLSSDGSAVTLETLGRQQAGQRLRLGTPRANFAGWLAEPPYGTDLVLAIASDQPLFATRRPVIEPVADFAAALRNAIAAARAAGQRVSADLTVIEVTQR
jgi:chemotaxis protein MotB